MRRVKSFPNYLSRSTWSFDKRDLPSSSFFFFFFRRIFFSFYLEIRRNAKIVRKRLKTRFLFILFFFLSTHLPRPLAKGTTIATHDSRLGKYSPSANCKQKHRWVYCFEEICVVVCRCHDDGHVGERGRARIHSTGWTGISHVLPFIFSLTPLYVLYAKQTSHWLRTQFPLLYQHFQFIHLFAVSSHDSR